MTQDKPLPYVKDFKRLFSGLETAYGTGKGSWVRERPKLQHYSMHLRGHGDGLGIAPLREDGTVSFAAIDLDEPDFDTARELSKLLPGTTFIEKSRSGNAHIYAFFAEPIEAWIPRGIMREATAALGKPHVEVFPKQDRLRIGMVGNYINLCYFGDTRPVIAFNAPKTGYIEEEFTQAAFVDTAIHYLNKTEVWQKRAHWLGVPTPQEREAMHTTEFGSQPYLHRCAEYAIANRESNPIIEGHRAVAYFSLSKMLANCNQFDSDEALAMLGLMNDASPDPITEDELRRIYFNAERGQFTSTGCDDPLFLPYADPECPIAHPERRGR